MPSEGMSKPWLCRIATSGQAHPHAIGARADLIFAGEEGGDLVFGEVVVLGPEDGADARPRAEIKAA